MISKRKSVGEGIGGGLLNWLHGKKEPKQHGARIEDYALIGDCETAALVSREGSIDWLCWPNFGSGACFAALLGSSENGFWKLRPTGDIQSPRRRYRPGTLIVETTFITKDGEVCLALSILCRHGTNTRM
jgi:GH15 family glucan-1,4-alpha-glucosidase